jgi:hypothetical protein
MTEERLKDIQEWWETKGVDISNLITEIRRCHAERESLRELLRESLVWLCKVSCLSEKEEDLEQLFRERIDEALGEKK